jgi:hypothetical protein
MEEVMGSKKDKKTTSCSMKKDVCDDFTPEQIMEFNSRMAEARREFLMKSMGKPALVRTETITKTTEYSSEPFTAMIASALLFNTKLTNDSDCAGCNRWSEMISGMIASVGQIASVYIEKMNAEQQKAEENAPAKK